MMRHVSLVFTLMLMLLFLGTAPVLGQNCPPWAISAPKGNTLYLYFPTAADSSFPEYGSLGASTSPVAAFDVADLDASIGTTADLRDRIFEIVVNDYCEFNVGVEHTTTMPTPTESRWQIVGIGSDSETITYMGQTYYAFGLAQDVDLGDADGQDYARVWAATFGDAWGDPGEALNGANSTLERWARTIGETTAHEAGHNYGLGHPDAVSETGEDDITNHILATGDDLTGEIRASRNRHFSDTSYQLLGHNVGLNWETFHNWDFRNPNSSDAHALEITILSEASSLTIADYYDGSMSPWTAPTIINTGATLSFQGTVYDIYELELSTAQGWNGTTPGVVPPAGDFHVGVVFAEPDAVIVRETTLKASNSSDLPLKPRLIGYDAGAADLSSGDFTMSFFNPDPAAGALIIEELSISYLPRLPDINSMIEGAALVDFRGLPVNELRVPRIFRDDSQPRPRDEFGVPGQKTVIEGGRVMHPQPIVVTDRVEARLAGLAAGRHVDRTYDDEDCEMGVIPGSADISGGELRYCPNGIALSLFPATSVYVTATVVDPNATYYDPATNGMVTGELRSKVFYQLTGFVPDFNGNGVDDLIDIRKGNSQDDNGNGVPDEAEPGRGRWSLHFGIAEPKKDLAHLVDDGFTINIDYVRFVNRHLDWDLRFGLSRFDGLARPPEFPAPLPDLDIWTLSANLKYTFNPMAPVELFVNGGPGVYWFDPGNVEFGANLGLGVAKALGPKVTAELTYNYHWPFTASQKLEYSQSQVGFVVSF